MNSTLVIGTFLGAAVALTTPSLADFVQSRSAPDAGFTLALVDDESGVRGGVRKRTDDTGSIEAKTDIEPEAEAEIASLDPVIVEDAAPTADLAIDLGDDTSIWALDGQCDDPRFVGAGMAMSGLLAVDAYHDATDCRLLLEGEQISLAQSEPLVRWGIQFGDNSSLWSYDGECDDPRFEGPGMVHATPVREDLYRDAADCSSLYLDRLVELAPLDDVVTAHATEIVVEEPVVIVTDEPELMAAVMDGIEFGDDASQWSNDGECDDPRFAGPGMTETVLLAQDTYHDASDCLDAYMAGNLWLADGGQPNTSQAEGQTQAQILTETPELPQASSQASSGISLGTDSSKTGVARNTDAYDEIVTATIDFGDDRSQWAFDYECDDPRFAGPGMTTTPLLNQDMYHDATDCHRAWIAGDIWMR